MLNHWNSEEYSKSETSRIRDAIDVLHHFGCVDGDFDKVLDIGCGNGAVLSYLSDNLLKDSSIIGIDSDEGMLEYAKKHHKRDNVIYRQLDILNLYFKEEFSLVVSFVCLHWVEEQFTVLTNIFNALKINAQFIALMYPNSGLLHGTIQKISGSNEWSDYFKGFRNPLVKMDRKKYENLLRKVGFKFIQVESSTVYPMQTSEEAINVIRSWLPHLSYLPEERREQFLKCIISELPTPIPVDRLVVRCKK